MNRAKCWGRVFATVRVRETISARLEHAVVRGVKRGDEDGLMSLSSVLLLLLLPKSFSNFLRTSRTQNGSKMHTTIRRVNPTTIEQSKAHYYQEELKKGHSRTQCSSGAKEHLNQLPQQGETAGEFLPPPSSPLHFAFNLFRSTSVCQHASHVFEKFNYHSSRAPLSLQSSSQRRVPAGPILLPVLPVPRESEKLKTSYEEIR